MANYNLRVYSAELLDHFQNPRNAGAIEEPDSSAQLENPVCGDVLELTLKLEERTSEEKSSNRRIADIRFRAKGCVPTVACGSALTELAKGKTVEEARRVSREDLVREVGGLPQASSHAGQLAIDALAAVLRGL
jgi:nitrogen fixation protein NifU and related proteins